MTNEAPPTRVLSDSIGESLGIVRDILAGMPATAKDRAKKTAAKFEVVLHAVRTESPNDPAVALGAAFAMLWILEQLTENQGASEPGNLIQLLS